MMQFCMSAHENRLETLTSELLNKFFFNENKFIFIKILILDYSIKFKMFQKQLMYFEFLAF